MDELFGPTEPVSIVETSSNHIFLEDLDFEGAFFGNGFIDQSPTKALSVKLGGEEQPPYFIFNQGNKTDNGAIGLYHPCFGKGQINVTQIIGLLIEEFLSQKGVGEFTRCPPRRDHGFDVFILVFPDHCLTELSCRDRRKTGSC